MNAEDAVHWWRRPADTLSMGLAYALVAVTTATLTVWARLLIADLART